MPRWTVNCFATVETLTPLERAVRIASTSCSVSGVRDRLLGSVTALLSAQTIGSTGERTSPTPRFHAAISLSTTRRLFPQRSLRPTKRAVGPTTEGTQGGAEVVPEPNCDADQPSCQSIEDLCSRPPRPSPWAVARPAREEWVPWAPEGAVRGLHAPHRGQSSTDESSGGSPAPHVSGRGPADLSKGAPGRPRRDPEVCARWTCSPTATPTG